MNIFKATIFGAATLAATMAFAHSGVQNPAVKARMAAMSTIGASMKTLVAMAKGEAPFDAAIANAAFATISTTAGTVPGLFEPEEDDPKSEARAEIWFNWDDFVAKAGNLETASGAVSITNAADIGPALANVGGTCKACHTDYKS